MASSFNVDLEAEARAVVLRFLPNEWGSKTIVNAPAALKEVAEATGGVRTDQRVFTGDNSGRLLGYDARLATMPWPVVAQEVDRRRCFAG